jgi:hypothetical protein
MLRPVSALTVGVDFACVRVISLHWKCTTLEIAINLQSVMPLTWCWDWVERGQGVGSVLSLFHNGSRCENSVSRSGRFTVSKGFQWMSRGPLVEVTPVCETMDAHKQPHVLGKGCHHITCSRGSVGMLYPGLVPVYNLSWMSFSGEGRVRTPVKTWRWWLLVPMTTHYSVL